MEFEEREELTRVVRRLSDNWEPARLAADGGYESVEKIWSRLAELGLIGIALPESLGGADAGLEAEVIVLEGLAGRAAPVPLSAAYLAAHALAAAQGDRAGAVAAQLSGGQRRVGLALCAKQGLRYEMNVTESTGNAAISGRLDRLLDGGLLDDVLVVADGNLWLVALDDPGVVLTAAPSLDSTRPISELKLTKAVAVDLGLADAGKLEVLAWVFLAAEALGAGAAALEMSRTYALERHQFGQPIGLFQAIKHKLADGLVAVENARTAVSGAVRSGRMQGVDEQLARIAKAVATRAAVSVASDAIQIHGAIGCTWEFPLHLLLRRAKLCQLSLGSPEQHQDALSAFIFDSPAVASEEAESPAMKLAVDLGLDREDVDFLLEFQRWLDEESAAYTTRSSTARDAASRIGQLQAWQAALADAGWAGIHWPKAFGGRDASPTQQVLYHTEMASRRLPPLIGNRGLSLVGPTLMAHGTDNQQAKFIEATRRADILWASGLSEPGSGSDLASLRMKAEVKTDHVLVNGQKIWTSGAHFADYMFTLVRTGPMEPKHDGITVLLIKLDLPGITIRPIRRINGTPEFNEVFLDDVKVPLDCIVGRVGEGWQVARTTLQHEHMTNFVGAQLRQSFFMERIVSKLRKLGENETISSGIRSRVTQSWINTQLLRLHGLRNMTSMAAGDASGAEGSILKLFGQEEERRIYELSLDVLGAAGLTADREARGFLGAKAATIGGGTSEIHRNKIAERVMGMPRDLWADAT